MANIRVKTNNNTTTVRVGQTTAIKVVASNQSAATSTVDTLQNVGDINPCLLNTTDASDNPTS